MEECPRCGETKELYKSTGNCLQCRDDEILMASEALMEIGSEESVGRQLAQRHV